MSTKQRQLAIDIVFALISACILIFGLGFVLEMLTATFTATTIHWFNYFLPALVLMAVAWWFLALKWSSINKTNIQV